MEEILLAVLIFVALMAIGYAVIFPYFSGELKTEERFMNVSASRDDKKKMATRKELNSKRSNLERTLKDLEKAEQYRNNPPLHIRIQQAGLDFSPFTFWIYSAILGVAALFMAYIYTFNLMLAVGVGIAFGFGFPRWFLNFKIKRRIKQFIEELPNAIDIITRGVKAGLPINDCMSIVGREAKEPVRSEFATIIEMQQFGLPLTEAVLKMSERMPVTEANYFAIVIAIQQRSGGSISEILGNLAKVLRERKKLKNRILALSQEAKSSAAILASLPILLGTFLAIMSPQHMDLLFQTKTGNFMLVSCVLSMLIGIFVMKKMIDIKV